MQEGYDFLGFGIKGYKSFNRDAALVGPFGKVHLVTGQNNSGKSALVDIALRVLPGVDYGRLNNSYPFTNDDFPLREVRTGDNPYVLSLCFSKDSLMRNAESRLSNESPISQLEFLLSLPCVSRSNDGACWIDYVIPNSQSGLHPSNQLNVSKEQFKEVDNQFNGMLEKLALSLRSQTFGSPYSNLNAVFGCLVPWDSIPRSIKVSAIREATSNPAKSDVAITDGDGLINSLLRLSNPKPNEQYVSGEKWSRFLSFVRDVLDDDSADVRIDADATMIQVKTGGTDYLSLSALGTGIEELVILAAVVACNEGKLIIVEEPEIHLHPTLQAKIVRNLMNDCNRNRFLITTHSPSVINSENVTITQVVKRNGVSSARSVCGIAEAREVLDDLGAHPSDLLQSNFVVWVEGPSDRVYIRYWLSEIAPELTEGTHFSIMLYGGKLLNACCATETSTDGDDLISLIRINSHFCVVMDSDREKPRQRISKTKRRIIDECERVGCLAWVTDDRTIENYVSPDALQNALCALYPRRRYNAVLDDPYVCPLGFSFSGNGSKPNKIAVARKVVEVGYPLSDKLKKRVEALADAIRAAN